MKHLIFIIANFFIYFFLFCITVFLSTSCGPKKDEIIRTQVAQRVQEFVHQKEAECRMSLYQDAEDIVDSLLLAEATGELSDSLARLRPTRPAQPAEVPPIDSLRIQPIFPASSTRREQ
jgi:hypothetical protein